MPRTNDSREGPLGIVFDTATGLFNLAQTAFLITFIIYYHQAGWTGLFWFTVAVLIIASLAQSCFHTFNVSTWNGFDKWYPRWKPLGSDWLGDTIVGFLISPIGIFLPAIDVFCNLLLGYGTNQASDVDETPWEPWVAAIEEGQFRADVGAQPRYVKRKLPEGKEDRQQRDNTIFLSEASKEQIRAIANSIRLCKFLTNAIERRDEILRPCLVSSLMVSIPLFLTQLVCLSLEYYSGGISGGGAQTSSSNRDEGPPYGVVIASLFVSTVDGLMKVYLLCHSLTVKITVFKVLCILTDFVSAGFLISFSMNIHQPVETELFGYGTSWLTAVYFIFLITAVSIAFIFLFSCFIAMLCKDGDCAILFLVPFVSILAGPPLVATVLMGKGCLMVVALVVMEPYTRSSLLPPSIALYQFLEKGSKDLGEEDSRNSRYHFITNKVLERIKEQGGCLYVPKAISVLAEALDLVAVEKPSEQLRRTAFYETLTPIEFTVKADENGVEVEDPGSSFDIAKLRGDRRLGRSQCLCSFACDFEAHYDAFGPWVAFMFGILSIYQVIHYLLPFVMFPMYYDSLGPFTAGCFYVLAVLTFIGCAFFLPEVLLYFRFLIDQPAYNAVIGSLEIPLNMKDLEEYFVPPQVIILRDRLEKIGREGSREEVANDESRSGPAPLLPHDLIDHVSAFMPEDALDLSGVSMSECKGLKRLAAAAEGGGAKRVGRLLNTNNNNKEPSDRDEGEGEGDVIPHQCGGLTTINSGVWREDEVRGGSFNSSEDPQNNSGEFNEFSNLLLQNSSNPTNGECLSGGKGHVSRYGAVDSDSD